MSRAVALLFLSLLPCAPHQGEATALKEAGRGVAEMLAAENIAGSAVPVFPLSLSYSHVVSL